MILETVGDLHSPFQQLGDLTRVEAENWIMLV